MSSCRNKNANSDSAVYLLTLADAVANDRLPPDLVKDWIRYGVREYLNTDVSLDEALGLAGGRGRKPITMYLTWQRDELIRQACHLCGGSVSELGNKIQAFETRVWPRWQHLESPPGHVTDLLKLKLYEVFRVGVGVPGSSRQLRRICSLGT